MTPTRIELLGRLSIVRSDGHPVRSGLPGRRAELVFAYLAAEHERTVTRDALADALWPDMLPDSWAAALRGVVTDVRRYLEGAGLDPSEVLSSGRGGYQLRLPAGVSVDLDEARRAFEAARAELAAGAPDAAAERAERAVALARLPFLPQHEGEWVDGVRDDLESLHVRSLELLARARAQTGDARAAADAAERLVRAEPFDEAAHQLRIRVLGELGDRAAAARAYEHCRSVLASELGVRPSAETEAALGRALERPDGARVARSGPSDAGALAGYSVLVVEDHDFQRRTALQLLRSLGVGKLSEAPDGRAALDMLAGAEPPDVIVCDLDMPAMDGVEFIRHVAERGLAGAVIIASGMDRKVLQTVEAVSEGYGLPVLGALEKPVTARRLAELLASYRPAARRDEEGRVHVTARDVTGALESGRIVAHFRPVVNLATGAVSSAHVVARWRDPARGSIPPSAFLPVVESEGLARAFLDRMLELACAHLRVCSRAGLDIGVSIPIPAGLDAAGLTDRLLQIAHERGADPRQIAWTIGERSVRRNLADLARLRLKGFGLHLDEFAGGQSSREALERLPLTGVRIAAGLVSGVAGDARQHAALEDALDVARALDLPVVATGCDSASDFDVLLQVGCGHAEGAFIAEPMEGAELPAWARSWSASTSAVGGRR